MQTVVQYVPEVPKSASHELDADGDVVEAWARTGDGYMRLIRASTAGATFHPTRGGAPSDVLVNEGWAPADLPARGPEGNEVSWPDLWYLNWGRVWRYWITTPDAQLLGVRDFVAAAEAGGLPQSWNETAAEGPDGGAHTLCSFRLTMDGARSLGAEQSALMALADLPADVIFYQTVASIEGFTGVEKESRQPTTLEPQLYEPGTLFQTSHPDAAAQRGTAFGEADVLDVTGLSLT